MVPPKLNIIVPYDPVTLFLSMDPTELKAETRTDIYTPMFTAALFIVAETQKQDKCPPTDDWINQIWVMHTVQYYSAIKGKEPLPGTIHMNLCMYATFPSAR